MEGNDQSIPEPGIASVVRVPIYYTDAFPWGAWPRDAAVDTRK